MKGRTPLSFKQVNIFSLSGVDSPDKSRTFFLLRKDGVWKDLSHPIDMTRQMSMS